MNAAHATAKAEEPAGRGGGSNLFAESLDVRLDQLFAGHQALDPAVERGDGGGLQGRLGREVGGHAPDILHVRIHFAVSVVDDDVQRLYLQGRYPGRPLFSARQRARAGMEEGRRSSDGGMREGDRVADKETIKTGW